MKPSRKNKPGELEALQALIFRCIQQPLSPADRMQATTEHGESLTEIAERLVTPGVKLSSFERLEIYNQQYWWRLLGNFREDYYGLRAVLGQRRFERMALAYLQQCPSRSWTLRDLGQHLVGFLESHPHLTLPYTALALDVARVEWARTVAFDGTEHKPLPPQALARADAAIFTLRLQPYISLLELTHPVDKFFQRLRRTQNNRAASSNAASATHLRATRRSKVSPSIEPVFLAVHRVQYSVYYRRMSREAYTLLEALHTGTSLADACEKVFADSPLPAEEIASDIRAWFSDWSELGWFW